MLPLLSIALLMLAGQAAAAHPTRRRALGHGRTVQVERAPRPGRHDYLLNATLATRAHEARGTQGRATFYHPEWEGESAIGSCGGQAMNDHTMGVALSSPGWAYFAKQGLSKNDLCFKSITIEGMYGTQKARIMDTCPSHAATNTCFDICDIDLTYGLFGMLAEYDLGIVPIKWSFDDGTPNPCGNSKQSSHGNDNKHQSKPSTSRSSSSSPKPSSTTWSHSKSDAKSMTAAHIATASSSPSSKHSVSSKSQPHSATASESSSKSSSFSTELQWWDVVDPQWCPGIDTPKNTMTAAIGPTEVYPDEKLHDTCGKWITIVNENGKKTEAQVVMWLPGFDPNYLAVGSAYHDITADSSDNVTWFFN